MKISKIIGNIIFIILGFFFLWLTYVFLRPYTSQHIINAGNFAGITLSFLLSILCFCHKIIIKFIKKIAKYKVGKIILAILSSFIAICIILASYFSYKMAKAIKHTPTSQTIMIVLGCKVNGTEPSLMLKSRLDAAYKYLCDNPDVTCIVSGGQGKYEDITEAQAMQNYLVDCGINEDRIIMEDKSTSTSENIKFSLALLEDKPKEIIIVTDSYHQYRASILAKNEDVTTYSVSSFTHKHFIATFWVREWFGIAKDIIVTTF